MLQHINGGRADGTLERRFQTYIHPDLPVLDDFGLKLLHAPAPEDLCDVISERYERGSIMLTSNRALKECPDRRDSGTNHACCPRAFSGSGYQKDDDG